MSSYVTYHYRIKDSKKSLKRKLLGMAGAVNVVWNFCNERQKDSLRKTGPRLNKYKMQELTNGSSTHLGIHSQTVIQVVDEFCLRRDEYRKPFLSWRTEKSLPWIPFRSGALKTLSDDVFSYCGVKFRIWKSRPLRGEVRMGSINADKRGRFYLNVTCKIESVKPESVSHLPEVGVDLGLKDAAVLSTGEKFTATRYFRQYENKLAKTQRAKKKRQFRNVHAKIVNSRKDFNHKVSHSVVNSSRAIYVGDVSSTSLIEKTNLAKSVYDVSWYQLKLFIKQKALAKGVFYTEVNEAYSTKTCSSCGARPESAPQGRAGLSVREWVCSECGSVHDRDVNAAKNILRFGHESPKILKRSTGSPRKNSRKGANDELCISPAIPVSST